MADRVAVLLFIAIIIGSLMAFLNAAMDEGDE